MTRRSGRNQGCTRAAPRRVGVPFSQRHEPLPTPGRVRDRGRDRGCTRSIGPGRSCTGGNDRGPVRHRRRRRLDHAPRGCAAQHRRLRARLEVLSAVWVERVGEPVQTLARSSARGWKRNSLSPLPDRRRRTGASQGEFPPSGAHRRICPAWSTGPSGGRRRLLVRGKPGLLLRRERTSLAPPHSEGRIQRVPCRTDRRGSAAGAPEDDEGRNSGRRPRHRGRTAGRPAVLGLARRSSLPAQTPRDHPLRAVARRNARSAEAQHSRSTNRLLDTARRARRSLTMSAA